MAFEFDPKKILDDVAKNASKAASNAANVIGEAGNSVGNVVQNAGKTVGDLATSAQKNAASLGDSIASSEIGKGASTICNTIGSAGATAVDAIGSTAANVAGSAVQTANEVSTKITTTIKKNGPSARRKRARIDGFHDGIHQGASLAGERRYNFYYAYISTLCFILRSDDTFSEEEETWLFNNLQHLKLEGGLPSEVKENIRVIAENEKLSFEEVVVHLDKVDQSHLESIAECINFAIEADDEIAEEEQAAQALFDNYVASRLNEGAIENSSYTTKRVKESIEEYEQNIDRINNEFKQKTKLQGSDYAFLAGAILLQVLRVLIINEITKVESAGQSNRNEKVIHKAQDKLFNNFDQNQTKHSSVLYASKNHILTARGVPYDATAGGKGLFKGANHRFSTLGHDPILGLLFGTSNIMTNSITCIEERGFGLKALSTYSVIYDVFGKNPVICRQPEVGTISMLAAAVERVLHEPDAAIAALIKQILHIGTDLYTKAGIQLPFANMILDKAHVEKLTAYINMGEIIKIGTQAGLTIFINWLIAALHGCSFVFKNEENAYALETHQARTKKIILISDTIATSSSVIQAAITKNPKNFDLGGAAVLAYRLFTDSQFIAKLEEEYLNSGLNDIYERRAQGILY